MNERRGKDDNALQHDQVKEITQAPTEAYACNNLSVILDTAGQKGRHIRPTKKLDQILHNYCAARTLDPPICYRGAHLESSYHQLRHKDDLIRVQKFQHNGNRNGEPRNAEKTRHWRYLADFIQESSVRHCESEGFGQVSYNYRGRICGSVGRMACVRYRFCTPAVGVS